LGIDSQYADLFVKSRGNHRTIESFLTHAPPALKQKAIALMGAVAEKDLHDITPDVLEDHLYYTMGDETSPLYIPYVLNPRIELEMLHPYKASIQKTLSPEDAQRYIDSPRELEANLKSNIIPDSLYNPGRLRQSPTASIQSGTADPLNRSIAFVAICRSLGIPARIDPVSHITQFADSSLVWHDVTFGSAASSEKPNEMKGILQLKESSDYSGAQPKYYSHFTVSQIIDGKPQLLEFDDFETVGSINGRKHPLSEGEYLLVSGQRLADGSVLSQAKFFKSSGNSSDTPLLTIRQDSTALQVIGNLDAELLYTPISFKGNSFEKRLQKSILSTTGRGYYALGLIAPGHEPSSHALNDIAAAANEFEGIEDKVLILLPDETAVERFRISDYGPLPANVEFGIDDSGISDALQKGLELESLNLSDLPLFVVADTFNRIVFSRSGYSIHLGDTLARILDSLRTD
ncbi:MAG: transglutaminase-like domain-containing protein, partial [Muribaculaceae bacterium]|nr:transglutaminase-like domain-containing protein [Muribaculaceae bacterium]